MLHRAYQDSLRDTESLRTYLRNSARYPFSVRGRINTYQVFAGLARQIVASRGRVGIVVPSGIATDYFSQDYFSAIVEGQELLSLYDFENREGLFPGVHRNYKFCLLTLAGQEAPAETARFAFFLLHTDQLADQKRRFELAKKDLQRINPNTRTCPIFRTRRDADVTRRLYRTAPVLVNEETQENPWKVSFKQGLFNMSSDSHLFRTREELRSEGFTLKGNRFVRGEEILLPLYEGKFLTQFDHRHATLESTDAIRANKADPLTEEQHRRSDSLILTRYWVDSHKVLEQLKDIGWSRKWFLSYRRITRAVDLRSCWFSIVPIAGFGDTSALLLPRVSSALAACLTACMNSFVVDFASRQKISGIHLDFFTVAQLPVLPPDRYTPDLFDFIVPRVVELTYTAWDLQPFAQDILDEVGPETWARWFADASVHTSPPPEGQPATPTPFVWDEERRAHLRAELDGLYARLYGLTHEELDYILDTFPIVRRKDEERYGEYRTKRMVLEAFDSKLWL